MSYGRVIGQLTGAVEKADRLQQGMGLLPISADDSRSWHDWQEELDCRVNRIASEIRAHGRPSHEMVASLGAQVVALLLAVDRAEQLDLTSGQEAA